ncbi:MAG: RidA family protein [Alphaproteobacteria bacterium]|nr:RidA family protein [Alphaproteobacteria bacterium]
MMSAIDTIIDEMGLTLPQAKAPLGAYVPVVQSGHLLMISGQGPIGASGASITGRLGDGLEIEDGTRAAQMAGLNIIAQIKTALNGDFERLTRIVRLNGFVNTTPDFTHHPAVINGASELMHDVFGERGVHSRIAVGVASLPMNWAVEIDAVIEVAE